MFNIVVIYLYFHNVRHEVCRKEQNKLSKQAILSLLHGINVNEHFSHFSITYFYVWHNLYSDLINNPSNNFSSLCEVLQILLILTKIICWFFANIPNGIRTWKECTIFRDTLYMPEIPLQSIICFKSRSYF